MLWGNALGVSMNNWLCHIQFAFASAQPQSGGSWAIYTMIMGWPYIVIRVTISFHVEWWVELPKFFISPRNKFIINPFTVSTHIQLHTMQCKRASRGENQLIALQLLWQSCNYKQLLCASTELIIIIITAIIILANEQVLGNCRKNCIHGEMIYCQASYGVHFKKMCIFKRPPLITAEL